MTKPLGMKAYGSIPHLPDSRMGPADHYCHPGQSRICTTKARDEHDRIYVLEKVDGACCAVANIGGEIVGLMRAGYLAASSEYKHIRLFGEWVASERWRFRALPEGARLVGEWMAQAHGTIYTKLGSQPPFIVFDAFMGAERLPFLDAVAFAIRSNLRTVRVVSDGGPIPIKEALAACGPEGAYGAVGGVEGVVYRVERKGRVDFLAKYVRPDKVDGLYLPDVTGSTEVWHWQGGMALGLGSP